MRIYRKLSTFMQKYFLLPMTDTLRTLYQLSLVDHEEDHRPLPVFAEFQLASDPARKPSAR